MLLPAGTVVTLNGISKKVMIIGICQAGLDGIGHDYSAVPWPEGFLSTDKIILFDDAQIQYVHYCGMQDREQMIFGKTVSEKWIEKKGENKNA